MKTLKSASSPRSRSRSCTGLVHVVLTERTGICCEPCKNTAMQNTVTRRRFAAMDAILFELRFAVGWLFENGED